MCAVIIDKCDVVFGQSSRGIFDNHLCNYTYGRYTYLDVSRLGKCSSLFAPTLISNCYLSNYFAKIRYFVA